MSARETITRLIKFFSDPAVGDGFKDGDVCVVVGSCCSTMDAFVGLECEVVEADAGCRVQCHVGAGLGCNRIHARVSVVRFAATPFPSIAPDRPGCHWFPREYLRKKPPKAEDDSEPRLDFTPADPQQWPLTTWHPDLTKETA